MKSAFDNLPPAARTSSAFSRGNRRFQISAPSGPFPNSAICEASLQGSPNNSQRHTRKASIISTTCLGFVNGRAAVHEGPGDSVAGFSLLEQAAA
ncbi:MAG: hypothetical protein MUF31_13370, partial [Akkermansiaceae bacterium]|nr:hypothetical protein [Akkermansiaceae bacterium]